MVKMNYSVNLMYWIPTVELYEDPHWIIYLLYIRQIKIKVAILINAELQILSISQEYRH